jgi:hypothetical protein
LPHKRRHRARGDRRQSARRQAACTAGVEDVINDTALAEDVALDAIRRLVATALPA